MQASSVQLPPDLVVAAQPVRPRALRPGDLDGPKKDAAMGAAAAANAGAMAGVAALAAAGANAIASADNDDDDDDDDDDEPVVAPLAPEDKSEMHEWLLSQKDLEAKSKRWGRPPGSVDELIREAEEVRDATFVCRIQQYCRR
jgi:hypothetical protein